MSAYLGLTIHVEGRRVVPAPRAAPLRLSPSTWQMVVVRLEFRNDIPKWRPVFGDEQRQLAAMMIAEIVEVTESRAVQIDLDAPASAHGFCRKLLTDVRSRLGPEVFLSITALVSWRQTERSWLAGLPADEIVPMAFRMGPPAPEVAAMLQQGGSFAFAGCRQGIGTERGGEHVVAFNPQVRRAEVRPRKDQRAYFFPLMMQWSPDLVRRAEETFQP